MKIVHSLGKEKIEGNAEDASFMMTNKNGGYIWMGDKINSRYQGFFLPCDGKFFRIIESFGKSGFNKIENKFFCVERGDGEKGREKVLMPDFKNSLVYESNSDTEFFLDFREAYANDYANYFFEEFENGIIVKMNYHGENYYLVAYFEGKFEKNEKTFCRFYSYDKGRNSYPCERYVYSPGKIGAKKIVFSFSNDRENAMKESAEIFRRRKEFEKEKMTRIKKDSNAFFKGKMRMAYNSARIMLDGLGTKKGIFAGFPWFFQYWARDELISLKAFYGIDKKLSEKIMKKWVNLIGGEFAINSKEKIDGSFDGRSIDGVGWMFKRLEIFPEILHENREKIKRFFSFLDLEFIDTGNESWMDSIYRKNGIEVQAMKLYIFKLASKLDNKNIYSEKEKLFKQKVREKYFDGNFLYDADDKRIRPNIFIVYYFYPELLTKKEWERVVDNELVELWCDWGGLSSLSRKDEFFKRDYTGEIAGSYHNGDSWFWINNLAGLVLSDLNKKKYCQYIEKILDASIEEILFSGAIGNHSELSSASTLKSEGAACQAFSAAMFIELVEKIGN
ncbi:MAG: amylo-alpha-1,6-glucosidase [Candidatus Pacearchaeota archaeon]